MRKWMILMIVGVIFFTSCTSFSDKESAEEKLSAVLLEFELTDGVVYSTEENAQYPFTDAMAERLFFFGKDISALSCAESTAVYVSRRFSTEEIVVIKLFDLSRRDEVMTLFLQRAKKKENAIVFCDGVYVYLVCTEKNEEIKHFLV